MNETSIAGVVLAGGRSSRMGRNKALLEFNGAPLVGWMLVLLKQCGVLSCFVSGKIDGYDCLADSEQFSGPAAAIRDCLHQLQPKYTAVLFVPVDMPFLTPETLCPLMRYGDGAYYRDRPLPVFLPTAGQANGLSAGHSSVGGMIRSMNVAELPLPRLRQGEFRNLNTPGEWKEAIG